MNRDSKELSTSEISDLKKKLEEEPDSLIFVSLAEAYRKEGMLEEAYAVCKKGLEKVPDYSNAHLVLGRIYQGQKKTDQAVSEFKKVLEIDPENMTAHSLLGSLFLQKANYKDAMDEYQAILILNPDDDETQKLLKEAIEKAASTNQLIPVVNPKETNKSKKTDSDSMASVTMAELYLKQGHLDKAIETYEELIKKDPDNKITRQKLVELKEKVAIESFGNMLNKNHSTPVKGPKSDKPIPHPHPKNEDSKFSEDDIMAMTTNQIGKKAKPAEKPNTAESPKEIKEPKLNEPKKVDSPMEGNVQKTAVEFSPAQIEVLKGILVELASITGIRRCSLTSLEGISIVSVGENSNNDSLEKQSWSIFQDTSQSAKKLNQGLLRQVLVTAETGHILLVSFAGGILVVLAGHQINLGMLRLAMDNAAKKMEKMN